MKNHVVPKILIEPQLLKIEKISNLEIFVKNGFIIGQLTKQKILLKIIRMTEVRRKICSHRSLRETEKVKYGMLIIILIHSRKSKEAILTTNNLDIISIDSNYIRQIF
jgi:hypothetical protein